MDFPREVTLANYQELVAGTAVEAVATAESAAVVQRDSRSLVLSPLQLPAAGSV